METKETNTVDVAGAGQKLLAHSKSAEFTARRGLALELFPFIYGAGERMNAKAISDFLEKEQQIKLSSVTINKALKDPHKNWNLFFDMIEPAARILEQADKLPMKDFLFREEYFAKRATNPILKAAVKMLVKGEVAHACSVLRTKWFTLDWEVRMKARPFLEHRLGEKGGK
jgi:hypothetical protein